MQGVRGGGTLPSRISPGTGPTEATMKITLPARPMGSPGSGVSWWSARISHGGLP
jgi:hypothetical protein